MAAPDRAARALRTSLPASALTLALLAGCGETDAVDRSEAVARGAIVGGQPALTCQWPTVVLLSGCTATLVHPRLVVTAGHCGTDHAEAIFGESSAHPARRVPITGCRAFQTSGSAATDWAYCTLATPVNDVPIIPMATACEAATVEPGRRVVIVGFGDSDQPTPGERIKHWAETTVNVPDDDQGIQVGGHGTAPCYGDSGGPAFIQIADGSWRLLGIDSAGLADSCAAGDRMAPAAKSVGWIEQQSGVDVTPCLDEAGAWSPGAACAGFSMSPAGDGRQWANGCVEAVTAAPAAACAAGSDAPAGPGAPPDGDGGGCNLSGEAPHRGAPGGLILVLSIAAAARLPRTRAAESRRRRPRLSRRRAARLQRSLDS